MSVNVRIIEGGIGEITQEYKGSAHNGIDIVNKGYTLGNIVAHSDGVVISTRNDCNGFENGSYGNYVKIKHNSGFYTLYAHGAYNTVKVKPGDVVKKGQVLMYMGNTGYSFGGHVHFEVRNVIDVRVDPTPYINNDLPSIEVSTKYKVGDYVNIRGVFVSSTSEEMLSPLITKGTITRIVEGARNPYLLDNGNIGWINDNCIVNGRKYKIGDKVNINGVFVSSESTNKLNPLITKGTITRIIEDAVNPYLLDNGNIGWVNDSVITGVIN